MKELMYRHVFNTQFNISFFTPKKDQCGECESHKNKPEDNEDEQHDDTSFLEHLEKKRLSRKEKRLTKGVPLLNLCVLSTISKQFSPYPEGMFQVFIILAK